MKIRTLRQASNLGVCMRTYYSEDEEIEISSEAIISLKEAVCYLDNGRYPINCCIVETDNSKEVIIPYSLKRVCEIFNFTSEKISILTNTKNDS